MLDFIEPFVQFELDFIESFVSIRVIRVQKSLTVTHHTSYIIYPSSKSLTFNRHIKNTAGAFLQTSPLLLCNCVVFYWFSALSSCRMVPTVCAFWAMLLVFTPSSPVALSRLLVRLVAIAVVMTPLPPVTIPVVNDLL